MTTKEKTKEFNLRMPSELKEKIEEIASQNTRSINSEIVFRLYNSFSASQENLQNGLRVIEELLLSMRETPHRGIVQQRLKECLEQINAAGFSVTPERLARGIGEQYAEPIVNIFTGTQEPSFTQLDKIATYLNINPDWLLYGENSIFDVKYTRLPRTTKSSTEWLLNQDINPEEMVNPNQKPLSNIYFIRNDSELGELLIVKQYKNWNCIIFKTPYEISGQSINNDTQKANLAGLSSTWKLLYQTKDHISIQSYIISQESFTRLAAGDEHPLSILKSYSPKPWWEDIWDIKNYKGKDYWNDWDVMCERINRIISSK